MSQPTDRRYRPGRAGPLRAGQDLKATEEGGSRAAEGNHDDDTSVSDGGHRTQLCRDSLKKGKATRLKKKRKLRKKDVVIGTWNVRTMLIEGKLDLLLEELKDNEIDITGLSETRWKKVNGKDGVFKKGEHTIVFSGTEKDGQSGVAVILDKKYAACMTSYNCVNDRIVTVKLNTKPTPTNLIQVYAPTAECEDEVIEKFYNDLQTVTDKIPRREVCIIMGDLNAKVGEGEDKECGIGPYGLGARNERGDMLAAFCQANNLTITNTLFQQHPRKRYTWISPGDRYRNQIDYIMINSEWKSSVIAACTRPGVDCESDHILVTAKIRTKAFKKASGTPPVRFDLEKLQDPQVKLEYQIETQNRFTALLDDWSANETLPNEMWTELQKNLIETAEAKLGRKKHKPSKPYISEEVFQLAKEKSKARKTNKQDEYKRLKKEIRKKIRRDKVEWLQQECSQITDANVERNSRKLFSQIKKLKPSGGNIQSQSLNDKNGIVLSDTKKVLMRWKEYGTELFQKGQDDPERPPPITFETEEPEPLLEEVRAAVHQLKTRKAPGLDNVPAELLKNSGEMGIKALHSICCKIWTTCQWPKDWKIQEFVMLYKSGNMKECNNYRTIALISHASKVLLIIILNRLRGKVEEELSDCQAGYRTNRGTVDMLFTLQLLIEKVRNSVDEAFIVFIDYSKAFDSVKHQHLFEIMTKMGFPRHLVALIASLYTDQKATIRWNGEHSDCFGIEKGVRQGCILSPHLFSIYTEQLMREADIEDMGIRIGGRNITDLRYADDTALLADNITSTRRILHKVDTAGRKTGLKLNAKKTKVLHIKGRNSQSEEHTKVKVDGTNLETVKQFKYLGSIKTDDGSCTQDIKVRIAMAKQKMVQLNNIWKDRGIPNVLKVNILKCLIWPVATYGCEAWTLKKDEEKKINAAELWFYRRLLRIQWTEKRTNNSVLEELAVKPELLSKINRRKLNYLGHANRNTRTNLMATVLQGKVEAKRNRGRPPISYMASITANSGLSLSDVVHKSRDRQEWRATVARLGAATIDPGDADR